jgi:hypothetical protein
MRDGLQRLDVAFNFAARFHGDEFVQQQSLMGARQPGGGEGNRQPPGHWFFSNMA